MSQEGAIVDASWIAARTSIKNKEVARDPEMHYATKGNKRHFGIKMHIRVDGALGIAITGPAHEQRITRATVSRRGEETETRGDAGRLGIES